MNLLHDPAAQRSLCVVENPFLRIRVKHRNHPGFSETCLAAGSLGDLRWRLPPLMRLESLLKGFLAGPLKSKVIHTEASIRSVAGAQRVVSICQTLLAALLNSECLSLLL